MNSRFLELKQKLASKSPEEGLKLVSSISGAAFSSSLGLEDQLITHWIATNRLPIRVFTLDTGRLFQETYDLLEVTRKKYNQDIEIYFPSTGTVETLVHTKGPNSFYESVENRKECCFIRKVEPLNRALADASVWITGVRAGQSDNRKQMDVLEWDEPHRLIKYNPLLHWSREEVEAAVESNGVPVNVLHNRGYLSIGCAPCTRSLLPGEDERAGRWWWETSSKECGLHEHAVTSRSK